MDSKMDAAIAAIQSGGRSIATDQVVSAELLA